LNKASVGTPPGIGDTYWTLTKMESFKQKNGIDYLTVKVHRDSVHFYTAEFLKMIPFIDEIEGTSEQFRIGQFYADKQNPGVIKRNTQGVDYLIDPGAQMWLKGRHLKDILPEYKTNYHIPLDIPPAAAEFAEAIKDRNKKGMVLFYTSSIGNNRNWNRDDFKTIDWMELLTKINKSSGIRPIAIGAEWDRDYFKELKKLDTGDIIQDFVGALTIQQTIALILKSKLVIGFACGIPIMAVYNKIPTVIFWATKGISKHGNFDESFKYTWTPPGIEKTGLYFPVDYGGPTGRPEAIFKQVKKFINGRG